MADIIRVTPDKLISTANQFDALNNEIRNITSTMLQQIRALGSGWTGEASNAYLTRFQNHETDMAKMYKMISTYCRNLNEMAQIYSQAETRNVESAQGLRNNVIE